MGGINIAMYDLLGKRMKMPLYKLLGGAQKEKIRIYASNGLFDNSKQLLEDAKKAYSLGFRVYKMRVISPDTIIDLVKSFNKKFKNKMQLIVDAVQGSAANPWATKVSINLAKKLEKEEIVFLEEPFRVENLNVEVFPRPDRNEFEVNIYFDIIGQQFPSQAFQFILEATR